MSRVAVTGAAGFVGSHVAEALVARGDEVVGIDAFIDYYPRPTKEGNLSGLLDSDRFRFVEADLRTAALEPILDGLDAIVHEAAMPGLPRSWSDFDLYVSCNLVAVERLLAAARAVGVRRILHVSTSSVYGLEAVGDETMPTRPVSPYGVTKLAAEHLVLANVDTFGLDAVITRYFSIYGPRQRPDMAYHRFTESLLDDEPITVFGDGLQTRSNTYVEDAVAGTLAALDRGRAGEIYNIGGGEVISVLDAIGILARALGREPRVEHGPPRPGDQRHTAADTTKAREQLGYRPTVGPNDGLVRQATWQRQRRAVG
ncbi:MAG TPA: NAD-dependent epimerase/dehydratase family protein [Candidatus Limnocylindrales bacterium]|nr:NAD-dependent epimerase/dehydratase family protein [Candidatus Limnocylindrales bacterium]